MSRRTLHWINSPVLFEALIRYEQGRLPRPMKLWVEQLLDIKANENKGLVPNNHPS